MTSHGRLKSMLLEKAMLFYQSRHWKYRKQQMQMTITAQLHFETSNRMINLCQDHWSIQEHTVAAEKKHFLVLLLQVLLHIRRSSLVYWPLICQYNVAQQSCSIKNQLLGMVARPFTYIHLGKLCPKNTVNSHHQS